MDRKFKSANKLLNKQIERASRFTEDGSCDFDMLLKSVAQAYEELESVSERYSRASKAITADIVEKQQVLDLVLSSVAEGVYLINTQGTVSYINNSALEMLGYEESEVIGVNQHELIHHTHKDGSPYDVADCPIYQTLAKQESNKCDKDVFWRKDGSCFPVMYSSIPITFNNRELLGAVVTFSDITDSLNYQKKLENEVSEKTKHLEQTLVDVEREKSRADQLNQDITVEKERLDTLMQNMMQSVITIDQMGTIQSFNRWGEKTFGYSAEEVIGQNVKILMPEPYSTEHDTYLENHKKYKTQNILNKPREIVAKKKNGETFPILLNVSKVSILDETVFIGLITDITEQTNAKQELELAKQNAEEANRAKSDFLANMSHEIRTPMNAVLGMSNLLLDTKLDVEQKEWARAISNSGNTLLNIINDIIDFSKIEAGKLALENIEFDFYDMLQEVSSLYAVQAREKKIEMLFDFGEDIPQILKGDPVRLKQIFANLISNALKFTASGHILIDIKRIPDPKKKDAVHLVCRIEDTGIGIAKDKHNKIFQKFSQAEESTTRKFGGTGLGLTIVSELIDLMQGDIRVESNVGEGATFVFDLYLGKVEQDLKPDGSIISVNALVIDDYELTRTMLKTTLERAGMTCDCAETAEQAIQMIADDDRKKYDICLVDYFLEGMNGLSFVEAIRKNNDYNDLILFIVSGAMENKPYKELKEMGLQGYIKKPFRQDQMVNAIKTAMSNRSEGKTDAALITRHNSTNALKEGSGEPTPYTQYEGKRVLAVEDMKMNMILIKKVLSKFGLDIDMAVNGLEACEKVKKHAYDIVFMDCQMPEMDGFEATLKIREYEKQLDKDQVPIIALTADAMVGDREKCLSVGMTDYINKPFKEEDIGKALQRYIAAK